jgi:hypothetical protein
LATASNSGDSSASRTQVFSLQPSVQSSRTTQSQSHIATDGQSVSVGVELHRGSWPDIYYCLTVVVLFLWGALSTERTGLSFVYAAGPCQRNHSRVRVPWDSQPYFTVSFRRLLWLAGSRWWYSLLPAHFILPSFPPLLLSRVGWYAWQLWVLVRMIRFISTLVTSSLNHI